MNLKNILILLFTLIATILLSGQSEKKITLNWIKTKRMVRSGLVEKRKLIEYDESILKRIQERVITDEIEDTLSILIYEIVFDNAVDYKDNSINALDILQKKFKNKNYFFDVSSQFVYSVKLVNPFIVEKILNGYTKTLESNYEVNIISLKTVYNSIKTTYIYRSLSGTIPYGTDNVITELIAYIRTFVKLIDSDKIKATLEQEEIIANIYTEMGIEDGRFLYLNGARDLMNEY